MATASEEVVGVGLAEGTSTGAVAADDAGGAVTVLPSSPSFGLGPGGRSEGLPISVPPAAFDVPMPTASL